MKLVPLILSIIISLAQAGYDRDKVFPRHIPSPPHLPIPNANVSSRITGGEIAFPHSLPYQAALFLPVQGGTAFCGGVLIASRTVLTAAHCVDGLVGPVEVVLGGHYVFLVESTQNRQFSSNVIIHPDWNAATIRNDIAIIVLPQTVLYDSYIQPILLPSNDDQTYSGLQARISGWGKPSDDSETVSDVLRNVLVPVISNTVCNIAYLGNVFETNICTSGGSGRSSCSGDSGGPVVIDNVLVGAVSFGLAAGCEVGWPSVHTRISKYLEFITSNTYY